jgi:hypothetical protein
MLVRDALGPDLCDELVPLACGDVLLHKIKGSMHDTCNTANLVPHLVLEMRETSGRLYYGEEEGACQLLATWTAISCAVPPIVKPATCIVKTSGGLSPS